MLRDINFIEIRFKKLDNRFKGPILEMFPGRYYNNDCEQKKYMPIEMSMSIDVNRNPGPVMKRQVPQNNYI